MVHEAERPCQWTQETSQRLQVGSEKGVGFQLKDFSTLALLKFETR